MTPLDATPPDASVWLVWLVGAWAVLKLERDRRAGGDAA